MAVFVGAWGVNQFTPMATVYRLDEHWSSLRVAAMFSIYLLGLLPALLWGGPASNRHGRKIVKHALLLSCCASLLLSAATPFGELGQTAVFISRFVTGLSCGVILSAGTAWVGELSVGHGPPGAGARRATLTAAGGFGGGALASGIMMQFLPYPAIIPVLVHAALTLGAYFALRGLPDGVPPHLVPHGKRGVNWEAIRHPRFRRIVLPAGPAVFAAATVAYVVLPSLVADKVASYAPLFSGIVAAVTLGVGIISQPIAVRIDREGSARAILFALIMVVIGLCVGAWAAAWDSPGLVVFAAAWLGSGYGLVLAAGLREMERLAPKDGLSSATSIYQGLAHGGLLTPLLLALGSGAAPYPVLLVSMAVLGVVIVGLAALASSILRTRHAHQEEVRQRGAARGRGHVRGSGGSPPPPPEESSSYPTTPSSAGSLTDSESASAASEGASAPKVRSVSDTGRDLGGSPSAEH
ncbi:MFS transporter [Pseudonocardia phyllosphaerae]|uniref:MFS transporter n=1 Tax=Pseudonocardia phyllosphaerae TaxID=3390502 RepID=UPI00397D2A0F